MYRRGYRVGDPAFLALVRRKLELPKHSVVDLSTARFAVLKSQLDTALKPVLRPQDLASFDMERAFATVTAVADALIRTP